MLHKWCIFSSLSVFRCTISCTCILETVTCLFVSNCSLTNWSVFTVRILHIQPNKTCSIYNCTGFFYLQSPNLTNLYFQVTQGSANGTILGTYCGSSLPPNVTSLTGSIYLNFTSDSSIVKSGFRAIYFSDAREWMSFYSLYILITKNQSYPSLNTCIGNSNYLTIIFIFTRRVDFDFVVLLFSALLSPLIIFKTKVFLIFCQWTTCRPHAGHTQPTHGLWPTCIIFYVDIPCIIISRGHSCYLKPGNVFT